MLGIMEEEPLIDPLEINKDPKLIKDAQDEIGKLDVLVCGECHDVFHYIEQFQDHRLLGKCTGISPVRDNYKHESKPQVWAFMLWKSAQLRRKKEGEESPTSWVIYQRWCKLDMQEKEAWIAAGRNIQSFTKISLAKMQEIKASTQLKNRIIKPVSTVTSISKKTDEDPLEEGEIRLSQLSDVQRLALKAQTASKNSSEVDPLGDLDNRDSDSDLDTEDEVEKEMEMLEKDKLERIKAKSIVKKVAVVKKAVNGRMALRTNKETSNTEEHTIDKIMNKRYNPRKKAFEYMIKWQNDQFENSWEPVSHLEGCKNMLEEFEENLRKQKLQKSAKPAILQKQIDKSAVNKTPAIIPLTPGGRPQRTSKQKAVNQVKVWCGDISEGDESLKRKFTSDDDSSDSFEKKIKLEDDSDTSDEEKPSVTIRRIVKTNTVNGVAKKETTDNILIPDAHGVVRVNQKQMPGLSSGVYIMSKTQGIIKLDSNKDIPGTAAGSTVFKVAPKIGQTRIKVIKKEDGSTSDIIKVSPASKTGKSTSAKPVFPKSSNPRVMAQRKASMTMVGKKPIEVGEPKVSLTKPKSKSDDESDGLEELEFPTDLPLPEPDSPPGEFTLCPLTGKILGQDDNSENLQSEEPQSQNSTELENLVKAATVDLLDKTSDGVDTFSLSGSSQSVTDPVASAIKPENTSDAKVSTAPVPKSNATKTVEKLTTVKTPSSSSTPTLSQKSRNISNAASEGASSILSTALSNSNITEVMSPTIPQKKLLSTPTTVRQKATANRPMINRPMASKQYTPTTIITQVSSGTHKSTPRVKNMGDPVLNRTPNVATYSNKSTTKVARKIGNTTIYKTTTPAPATATATVVHKLHPSTSINANLHQSSTSASGTIINMPLLNDEPSTSTAGMNTGNDSLTLTADNTLADMSTFSLPDTETPLLITGDDGTIYQVAGQNEDGQTILITQGPDGQQQCVLVATESLTEETQALSLDTIAAEDSDTTEQLMVNTEGEGSEDSQVVAQIVKAEPPSPGGTRKVVLMLPDGNLMVTEVSAEQYAALDLDK